MEKTWEKKPVRLFENGNDGEPVGLSYTIEGESMPALVAGVSEDGIPTIEALTENLVVKNLFSRTAKGDLGQPVAASIESLLERVAKLEETIKKVNQLEQSLTTAQSNIQAATTKTIALGGFSGEVRRPETPIQTLTSIEINSQPKIFTLSGTFTLTQSGTVAINIVAQDRESTAIRILARQEELRFQTVDLSSLPAIVGINLTDNLERVGVRLDIDWSERIGDVTYSFGIFTTTIG